MSKQPSAPIPAGDGGGIPAEGPHSQAFVNGLIQRGEAVKLKPGSALPPGATHEIVGETEAGEPVVRRKRFSAF